MPTVSGFILLSASSEPGVGRLGRGWLGASEKPIQVFVDGRECGVWFDDVEFEKLSEASQRENEVRFDDWVAV